MNFEDFKLFDGNYVMVSGGKPIEAYDIVYYHTTLAEMLNAGTEIYGGQLVKLIDLPQKIQLEYRLALYFAEYGATESYIEAKNLKMKDSIEEVFINLLANIGMKTPENHEDIVQSIFEYILGLPKDVWGSEDVVFGFQYWIEAESRDKYIKCPSCGETMLDHPEIGICPHCLKSL